MSICLKLFVGLFICHTECACNCDPLTFEFWVGFGHDLIFGCDLEYSNNVTQFKSVQIDQLLLSYNRHNLKKVKKIVIRSLFTK